MSKNDRFCNEAINIEVLYVRILRNIKAENVSPIRLSQEILLWNGMLLQKKINHSVIYNPFIAPNDLLHVYRRYADIHSYREV